MEIWKDIPEYEGLYQGSSLGRVKSLNRTVNHKYGTRIVRERILLPKKSNGYFTVTICKDNIHKTRRVHQLIAMAFLEHVPCGQKWVVNHIDRNKLNNKIDNLEVISNRENVTNWQTGTTSQYTGVSMNKYSGKWKGTIYINGKNKHLGYFKDEYEAHLAYQKELSNL